MIRIDAPAKVNLGLRVLAREGSGYHQLETLFLGLELSDSITVSLEGKGISLETDEPHLCPPEENLVYRAARGFLDLAQKDAGLKLVLVKRIPAQAGLGGGSSDAAATLKALAALRPRWVSSAALLDLAGELGADVPFFLSPSPFALAWGRGGRLLSLTPLPRAPVLLALPPFGVSTGEAYRKLAEEREGSRWVTGPKLLSLDALSSWARVSPSVRNDFEDVIFRSYPFLGRIRRAMAEKGSLLSLLSGSGSALYSVFREPVEALEVREELAAEFPDTRFLLTHTLTRFSDPILRPGVED